jgi:hypothetical protein
MEKQLEQSETEYEAPKLTVHGNIAEVTRSGEMGERFDATFNRGEEVPDPDGDNAPNIFS